MLITKQVIHLIAFRWVVPPSQSLYIKMEFIVA